MITLTQNGQVTAQITLASSAQPVEYHAGPRNCSVFFAR